MPELNSFVVMTNWPELVLWSRKCNLYLYLEVKGRMGAIGKSFHAASITTIVS